MTNAAANTKTGMNEVNLFAAVALADQILAAFDGIDSGDVVDCFELAVVRACEAAGVDADSDSVEEAAESAWLKVA